MQAVILAAGLGLRLRGIHDLPKGFLQLGENTIIRESIWNLRQCGISEILIITGYAAVHYEALIASDDKLATCHNSHFDTYGSLYSLYQAKNWVREEIIVLESDIIYEQRGLKSLINHEAKNAILVSGWTQSGDEVYVETKNTTLLNMSKSRQYLSQTAIMGEFVGLTKLSFESYQHLVQRLASHPSLLHQGHYDEHGLVDLATQYSIECVHLPDLLWAEIDNHCHLIRAQKVYAEIQKKENKHNETYPSHEPRPRHNDALCKTSSSC